MKIIKKEKISLEEIRQYNKIIKKKCTKINNNDLMFVINYKNKMINNININKDSALEKIVSLNNDVSNLKSNAKENEDSLDSRNVMIKNLQDHINVDNFTLQNVENFQNKNNSKIDKKLIYNILIILALILFMIYI